MKKLAVLCITALGAALLVVGIAPPASAYPEVTCTVDVNPQTVRPGQQFTVTGTTPVAVDSKNKPVPDAEVEWTFTWNGVTKVRTGKTVQASFTAPETTKTRVITLTARNTSPAGTCVRTVDVTVLGSAVAGPTPDDGVLPGTGGPAFWLLVAALALLLVGGGTVIVTRRRS